MDLPEERVLYRALLERDPAWDGRVLVGVTTTGIFCRLSCPARKPRPENCRWFAAPAEALAAGFRPCRRCQPTEPADIVARLDAMIAADPGRRWTEADLTRMGHDISALRRSFRRRFGQTFLQRAREARLRAGARTLDEGGQVIDAQLDAGFDSASGFRRAFARLFGQPPAAMRDPHAELVACWLDTPLGGMVAVAGAEGLHLLEFTDRQRLGRQIARLTGAAGRGGIALGRSPVIRQTEAALTAYFEGREPGAITLLPHGTAFQRRVWDRLRQIRPGTTRSYGEIAAEIGRPEARRAVAQAIGANPIALLIPCHRVIGADGALTGYAGGVWRKQRLLAAEAAQAKGLDAGRPPV